ncbi:hypothetical protein [Mycetocola saprophilus]|uniref:hypothetical protein n=1 Tax=Mycetocola saprophilus TaxID=76636 RepID=UPI003BF1F47E
MSITTRIISALLIGGVALGLAGCTPEAGTTVTSSGTAIPELPRDGIGIARSVTLTSATKKPGTDVSAEGTVTLPQKSHGTVFVSVSWINSQTATVYTRQLVELRDVPGGTERRWTVGAKLPADARDVDVVLGATLVEK